MRPPESIRHKHLFSTREPSIWNTADEIKTSTDGAIRLAVPLQFAAPSPGVSPGGIADSQVSDAVVCRIPPLLSPLAVGLARLPWSSAARCRAQCDDKGEVMDLSGHRQHRSDQP
jgi:hypothetical protein